MLEFFIVKVLKAEFEVPRAVFFDKTKRCLRWYNRYADGGFGFDSGSDDNLLLSGSFYMVNMRYS